MVLGPLPLNRNDSVRPDSFGVTRSSSTEPIAIGQHQPRLPPRHRVDPTPKKPRRILVGSLIAGCTALAITGALVIGGLDSPAQKATAVDQKSEAPSISVTPEKAAPTPLVRSSVIAAAGESSGSVTGGTVVTVTGDDLSGVTTATFGENAGEVVSATNDTVTIETPPATGTGTVPVTLFSAAGTPIAVAPASVPPAGISSTGVNPAEKATEATDAVGSATSSSATSSVGPAAGSTDASASATAADPIDPAASATALVFEYVPDARIAAQIAYVQAHWQNYNSAAYGRIPGNDCVNFASQSLIARGWAMDAEWSFSSDTGVYSTAWSSSTAFASYLAAHPEKASALSDEQRASVKVGDIVQFDWDRSGDRDHTGVVSRVEKTDSGVQIYFAGHTLDSIEKSVDESLLNTGATVSYWSIK